MAFKNSITDNRLQAYSKTDADISDSIAILVNNFGKVMRRLVKKIGRNISLVVRDNQSQQQFQKGENFQRSGRDCDRSKFNNSNKSKGIQCHECEWFGYIRQNVQTLRRKEATRPLFLMMSRMMLVNMIK